MPTEIRHVLFSADEATTAIRNYCISAGLPFPNSASIYTLEGGQQPLVRISPVSPRGRDAGVAFTGQELLAALLLHCQKKRIPLPARGGKEVTILSNQLTLVVKLMEPPARLPGS